jgi:hypothetical protein
VNVRHYHAAVTGQATDRCADCGRDLRDDIHIRTEPLAEARAILGWMGETVARVSTLDVELLAAANDVLNTYENGGMLGGPLQRLRAAVRNRETMP